MLLVVNKSKRVKGEIGNKETEFAGGRQQTTLTCLNDLWYTAVVLKTGLEERIPNLHMNSF